MCNNPSDDNLSVISTIMTPHSAVLVLTLIFLPALVACSQDTDSRGDRREVSERQTDRTPPTLPEPDSNRLSSFDWRAFRTAWEAYMADPGPHTGATLSRMVPAWDEIDEFWDTWDRPREPEHMLKAIDTAMFWGVFDIADQIERGDTSAVRLAVRLRRMSTGHMSEELDIVIGSAIIPMPRVFLRALKEEGVPDYDGILGNLGPEYVDRKEASALMLRRRRSALLTVDDPDLQNLRDSLVMNIDPALETTERR